MKPILLHVVGARPNFMKVGPVLAALEATGEVDQHLVHTGQHYDEELSGAFFDELGLPRPDENLGVGSGSHAAQTAEVMVRMEPVLQEVAPARVFVYGDVNSTVAAALTAAKLGIPVAHVEAGLRSGDRSMPEELNRIVTDQLGDALFATERAAVENLEREGVAPGRIHLVGNVMIDTLERLRPVAEARPVRGRLGLEEEGFVLVTLHRPGNVDDAERLGEVLDALDAVREATGSEVVFPMHPRTAERIERFGLEGRVGGVRVQEPLGYLDFLALMSASAAVLTDSGGIQEETTVLGVPCVTLRPNTERPVTVTDGTNRLFDGPLGELPGVVAAAAAEGRRPARPPLWDGKAGDRIAEITVDRLLGVGSPTAS